MNDSSMNNLTANDPIMNEICAKWTLPLNYLKFLQSHPKNGSYEIEEEEDYTTEVSLYGAEKLIEYQAGYAYNSLTGETIADWNPDFVVIADSEADPFCIDISREYSPIYFAEHGMGEWEFEEYCDSLEEFLELLGVE